MSKARRITDNRYGIFAAAVTAARTARQWNKVDLEKESGINRGVIGDIENGNTKYKPHEKTVGSICNALGMDCAAWIEWLNCPDGPAPNGVLLNAMDGVVFNVCPGPSLKFKTSTGLTMTIQSTVVGVEITVQGIDKPNVRHVADGGLLRVEISRRAEQQVRT